MDFGVLFSLFRWWVVSFPRGGGGGGGGGDVCMVTVERIPFHSGMQSM